MHPTIAAALAADHARICSTTAEEQALPSRVATLRVQARNVGSIASASCALEDAGPKAQIEPVRGQASVESMLTGMTGCVVVSGALFHTVVAMSSRVHSKHVSSMSSSQTSPCSSLMGAPTSHTRCARERAQTS